MKMNFDFCFVHIICGLSWGWTLGGDECRFINKHLLTPPGVLKVGVFWPVLNKHLPPGNFPRKPSAEMTGLSGSGGGGTEIDT